MKMGTLFVPLHNDQPADLNKSLYTRQIAGASIAQVKYGTMLNHRLRYALDAISRTNLPVDGTIVELGCGAGQYIKAICLRYRGCRCIGVDFSQPALNAAKNHCVVDRVCFLAADIYSIPLPDESVDAIFGFDIFEHVLDFESALREAWRVLRTGGLIHAAIPCDGSTTNLVGWMHRRCPRVAQYRVRYTGHVVPLTFEQVEQAFRDRFNVLDIKYSLHGLSQIRDSLKWLIEGPLGIDRYNPKFESRLGRMLWRIYQKGCFACHEVRGNGS